MNTNPYFLFVLAISVIGLAATAQQQDAKDAYIKQLETTLAKCLSRGDHPITIGDEVWFCGASNSGLKAK